MADLSAQALYDATNTCILQLLSGAQSASSGGRSYTMADLGALQKLRSELAEEISQFSGSMASLGVQTRVR